MLRLFLKWIQLSLGLTVVGGEWCNNQFIQLSVWCGHGICSGYFLTSFHIGLVAGAGWGPWHWRRGGLAEEFLTVAGGWGLQHNRCPAAVLQSTDVLQCDHCPPCPVAAAWRQPGARCCCCQEVNCDCVAGRWAHHQHSRNLASKVLHNWKLHGD